MQPRERGKRSSAPDNETPDANTNPSLATKEISEITIAYAQGMTQPAIHEFLNGIGIDISTGQVNNILFNEAEGYSKTSEAILTAGLEEAPYVRTDDTGEKHRHKSGYCTHIGGQYFAYYTTSFSKSRENFLSPIIPHLLANLVKIFCKFFYRARKDIILMKL